MIKVEESSVSKLLITNVEKLDAVTVFLEDFGTDGHRGKITIECFGKSWSAYWPGMGGRFIAPFFCSGHSAYYINCLDRGIDDMIIADEYEIATHLKSLVLKQRRNGELTRSEARTVYNSVPDSVSASPETNDFELLQNIMGDEWWYDLPKVKNPDYTYLERIVNAVRDGIALNNENKAAG